jgi:hypothetical protein
LDRRTDEKTWAASVVISIKIFGALIEKVGFAPDSLLEESGFEPLVPPQESAQPCRRDVANGQHPSWIS